nr:MAG: hypothetical protein DIU78_01370 [Pseudomonadota bacterium]
MVVIDSRSAARPALQTVVLSRRGFLQVADSPLRSLDKHAHASALTERRADTSSAATRMPPSERRSTTVPADS